MSEQCPNCGGEIKRKPEGILHKGPDDTWIPMSAGGWQSCVEKQLVAMVQRAKRAEAQVAQQQPVLDIVKTYSCQCDGGIPTPGGFVKCVGCLARMAAEAANP